MPKIKPNENCPCGSMKKYKKCCLIKTMEQDMQRLQEFNQSLDILYSKEIFEELRDISDYFKSHHDVHSIDITTIVNNLNLNQIYDRYKKTHTMLLVRRNQDNESVFKMKKAKSNEDIIVIYRNHIQMFNYSSEYHDAITEINKWFKGRTISSKNLTNKS